MVLSFRTDRPGQCRSRSDWYTVWHSVCIFWTNYSVVKWYRSNFRIITVIFQVTQIEGGWSFETPRGVCVRACVHACVACYCENLETLFKPAEIMVVTSEGSGNCLCCWHTWSMEVDEESDQKSDRWLRMCVWRMSSRRTNSTMAHLSDWNLTSQSTQLRSLNLSDFYQTRRRVQNSSLKPCSDLMLLVPGSFAMKAQGSPPS